MSDDIVARLRDCSCVPHGEICREAADEIERLRKERDDARREICLLRASSTNVTEAVSQEMTAHAISRGWHELFADEGKHERTT